MKIKEKLEKTLAPYGLLLSLPLGRTCRKRGEYGILSEDRFWEPTNSTQEEQTITSHELIRSIIQKTQIPDHELRNLQCTFLYPASRGWLVSSF